MQTETTNNAFLPKDVRDMAMLAHLLGFAGFFVPFGNIIGPLVVWLLKKEEHPFVDYHGREAVNFQVSFTLYYIILSGGIIGAVFSGDPQLLGAVVLSILIAVISIVYLVCMIIAAIKANEGREFRYPLTITFLN